MGLAFTKLFARLFSKKEMRILMVWGMALQAVLRSSCRPRQGLQPYTIWLTLTLRAILSVFCRWDWTLQVRARAMC